MTRRLMALIAFGVETLGRDVDSAAAALKRHGFTVTRMSETQLKQLEIPGDEFLEAWIDAPTAPEDEIANEIWDRVREIVETFGGSCAEQPDEIGYEHEPFAFLFTENMRATRWPAEHEAKKRCFRCRRAAPETRRMVKSTRTVKSPRANLCDDCLAQLLAESVKESPSVDGNCVFCGRSTPHVQKMLKLDGESVVCSECIIEGMYVLNKYEAALKRAGMKDRWDMDGP